MQPATPRVDPRLPGHLLEPLAGGWSGETFLQVPGSGGGDRLVARFFDDARHAPGAAGIQAALLERVRTALPVPAVHQAHDGDGVLPGLLVTELLPGERGDLVLARLVSEHREGGRRTAALSALGTALGRIAGTLAAMPMSRTGLFADATLRIEPFDLRLPDWVDTHAPRLGQAGWSDGEVADLRAVAERAAVDLDGAAPCLVHSDLNPKNVLVDPATLQVTGVLDWEFAHAGHPATDLGNLLRFDREPAYVDGVLDGWFAGSGANSGGGADRGSGEPDRRRATDLARAADLVALIDLAARAEANPVVRQARAHLRAIARTGDVNAAP
ncbi:phosphotransferase family protein [Promicromonospora sukumoe]|uniref:phosphotransferase family protein n=1 Tax=Promicromonospora sukumoe TaxID=88382 RepID=UPI00035CF135|nr:phosphotransferase [Promicromonospora sukumoe]